MRKLLVEMRTKVQVCDRPTGQIGATMLTKRLWQATLKLKKLFNLSPIMKILSFIFSFYILFLALEPGIISLSFTEIQQTGCCNDKSCQPIEKPLPAKKSEKKGCGETSNCNPFQICKTCTAFISGFALQTITPIILFAKPQANNKEKVPAQITFDFWQPPKMA